MRDLLIRDLQRLLNNPHHAVKSFAQSKLQQIQDQTIREEEEHQPKQQKRQARRDNVTKAVLLVLQIMGPKSYS
jgi:hypothetical protein